MPTTRRTNGRAEGFGWIKTTRGFRNTRHRDTAQVGWLFILTAAACNLLRLPKLLEATRSWPTPATPGPIPNRRWPTSRSNPQEDHTGNYEERRACPYFRSLLESELAANRFLWGDRKAPREGLADIGPTPRPLQRLWTNRP
jgi:hypothetical protein